jgi:hypothetical protein
MSNSIERYTLESKEKWGFWNGKIPEIEFKQGWRVKVIAPFAGAFVRFKVALGDASVSVYLDVDDSLGGVGEPYWEIYPLKDHAARFLMANIDELIAGIDESLSDQLI